MPLPLSNVAHSASDSHMQRAELARACFDALLTSSSEIGGIGHVAVSSLIERCSNVLVDFLRDWTGSGDLRLPRTRLTEMAAALQAVESLINRTSRYCCSIRETRTQKFRDPTLNELYQQLVSLYPSVVDLAPCCGEDPQLSAQIVSTLKSYQTLMLLKLVPKM